MNDIVNVSNKLDPALFADDAVLLANHHKLSALQKTLNQEMKRIYEWLVANELTLNLSKTKYMVFMSNPTKEENRKKLRKIRININKFCIKQVTEFKYLGVHIDHKLNWHTHAEYLCTKLSKASGMIYKLKNIAPREVLQVVYHSIVSSHLRYGILAWGSAKTNALNKLNIIHDKIIRYMKSNEESLEQAYKNLKILTIENLHKAELAKFVHLAQQGKVPRIFNEVVQEISHCHNTRARAEGNLIVPHPRTERSKTSVKYKGPKYWNELPQTIKQIVHTRNFVYELKKILLQNDSVW